LPVTDAFPFSVNVQLEVLKPPLEHAPDQMTSRPLEALSVMRVPAAKLADPVEPTGTLMPAGLDVILSPERPVAVTVRVAAEVEVALKKSAACLATPPYVAVITAEDALQVGPVVAVKLAWVCPAGTVTLAGTWAFEALPLESATTAPPCGAAPVSDTVPADEKPQLPLAGDMISDESADADEPPGLIVSCALAESVLQGALAEAVRKSCVPTARVEMVTLAL
jgi:hypothetical protein